jgi:hypothetical protein
MARLDPKDLETLDALITAGIVSNRADGVRWALARVRERPAYTQLREHIDLPVRNVSPAANEHDRAGQTGKSPMTSS